MTKFDMVTHVRNKHISGVSRPHPKGAGLERPQNFWDKHVCTKWFGLGRRNLGWQHMWGGGVFLGVIHAPIARRRAPSVPHTIFASSYTCEHTVWDTTTKFCMIIKLEVRKILCTVGHECWRAICLP